MRELKGKVRGRAHNVKTHPEKAAAEPRQRPNNVSNNQVCGSGFGFCLLTISVEPIMLHPASHPPFVR